MACEVSTQKSTKSNPFSTMIKPINLFSNMLRTPDTMNDLTTVIQSFGLFRNASSVRDPKGI